MNDKTTARRGPEGDMWRVDVAGYPVSVKGEAAHDHLLSINRQLAIARLALHRIRKAGCGNYEGNLAEVAIEEMGNQP